MSLAQDKPKVLEQDKPKVLSQDQAQASQAQSIVDERQYQKEVIQYGKDKAVYDKEKAAYDLQVKTIKDAETAEKKRIDDIRIAAEKKAADRAAEIKAVNDKYAAIKNPHTFRPGGKGFSYNNDSWVNWNRQYQESKKEALAAVTASHVKSDGFVNTSIRRGGRQPVPTHPTARKLYTGEAVNPVSAKAIQNNTPLSQIGNKTTRYEVEISRANAAVWAGGSLQAHASAVQSAKDTFDGAKKQEQLKFSAAAQKESINQQINDAKHWNTVINDPNTSKDLQKTNQATLEKQGLHIDVKALDASGVSSIYNVLDMSKSGSLPSSATVTINTKKYSISNQPDSIIIPTRTNTSGNKGVNKANIAQKQYVNDLRTGKVGLAQALLQPQTPQRYSPGNTINLKQFLVERGYDISKPETIPDSVLTTPVKYDAARKQATYAEKTNTTMGDLRGFIPSQPKVSDAILQKRQNALSFNASKESKGGSYIGYGPDGTPVQGAPFVKSQFQVTTKDGKVRTFNSLANAEKFSQRISKTQYEVSYSVPTKVPTMTGVMTIPLEETKTFDTKEEAQQFIDNRQANLPFTQDSKILPMEKMFRGYDKFADSTYQKAKDHVGMESSWMYEGGAAMASFGGDMINAVTMGGDLLDKHVFKRNVIEKQPITTIPTYYDKGTEKALEGIEITETGITGVPSFNPLDKNNIASKWYQGAAKQWEKQTPAQNIGQSAVAVPIAIFDVVTLGQAGLGVARRIGPVVSKVATKVASTPRIVTKVIEASGSVKTVATKPSYANYNINSIANPDKIDLNFKGVDYMESKAPTLDLNSLANRGIIPKSPKTPKTAKPVEINPDYKPTGRANEIDYTDNIDGFGNRVKDVSGARFISPKPTLNLRVGTFKKQTVEMGEQIGSIERNPINVGDRNVYGFTKQTVSLPRSATTKVSKGERYNRPNYDRASSDFADFQKSLDGTSKRYTQSFTSTKVRLTDRYNLGTPVTQRPKGVGNYGAEQFRAFQESVSPSNNIVGSIKLSKGFVPGKQTRQYKPYQPKKVQEEIGFKPDGKFDDVKNAVSNSPVLVQITKPDKIARLPKTGKAPIIGKEKYVEGIDFQPAKTPKGKTAPIGYEAPKPKPKPNPAYFSKMKSTKKNIDLTKDEPPRSRETGNSQVLLPPTPKPPKTKKRLSTGPTDPLLDVTITDSPLPNKVTKTNSIFLPPVIKTQTEKEKRYPKQTVIPRVIQTVRVTSIPVVKSQQRISTKTNVIHKQNSIQVQPQRLTQVQPQKSTQVIKQQQTVRQPLTPKPKVRQSIHPVFRLRTPQRVAQRSPTPTRKLTAMVFPTTKGKVIKKTEKRQRKRKDFLGNTRTDNIVGLFKRTEVITGDRKTAKQLKKDKKYKEGKKIGKVKSKKKTLNVF